VEHNESGPVVGPHVVWSTDSDGVCTLSTGPGLADLGVLPGELEGQNLFEVYRQDRDAVAHLHRVLAGEEFSVERPFGNRILSVSFQPVRSDSGTVTGAIGVTTDVTEQRRLERDALASRKRVAALAELSASLTREILDRDAMFRAAIRALTDTTGDVSVFWAPDASGSNLEPRTVWWDSVDLTSAWDARAASRSVRDHLESTDSLLEVRQLDLTGHGQGEPGLGLLLSELTERFALRACLRLPLRARGMLVGVIDLARSAEHGDFTDDDLAFALDVADRCALALDNALLLEAHRDAREQLVKFQALADASDNLIGIADNDGRLLYVNPRVYDAGIEPAADDVWRTVAEQVGDDAPAGITDALTVYGRWRGDLSLTAKGEQMTVDADVFVLHHPDTGAELGTAWIAQDVTEHRATAAALVAANTDLRQFKALVEASTDFIAIADLDGTVRYVNPPGRSLIGMPPEVDVTRTADYLTPEGLKASLEVEQPAVIAHGHWEGESTLRSFRGDPIPVAIASFLVRDSQTGEPFALATVQRDLTERLAAENALRELAEQRRALLTRLVDAQDAERARIAADVHDDPVQALAAVDLRLGLIRTQLDDRAPDLLPNLDQLKATVHGATDRLRALLFDLEPPDLQRGLAGAIERAAGELFDGTDVRWSVDGADEPDLPDTTMAVAYRIAREALINVRKHAGASAVAVTVSRSGDDLELVIEDDGVGLGSDPVRSPPGHRGLLNMEDRATVAGGRLDVRNRRPHGVTVTLWLPRN
jgi:PAS domain S-box-containing protein